MFDPISIECLGYRTVPLVRVSHHFFFHTKRRHLVSSLFPMNSSDACHSSSPRVRTLLRPLRTPTLSSRARLRRPCRHRPARLPVLRPHHLRTSCLSAWARAMRPKTRATSMAFRSTPPVPREPRRWRTNRSMCFFMGAYH